MAFKKSSLCDNIGEYIFIISKMLEKSILNIKTTPENCMIKLSHGSKSGISLNIKNNTKNAPIPNFRRVSIKSLTWGCVVTLPDNTNTICSTTSILKDTKK